MGGLQGGARSTTSLSVAGQRLEFNRYSLDGVEIVVLLQRSFGVSIKETEKGTDLFRSINTLSNYIVENSPHPLGIVPPEEK